jgi:predicted nuclease of predicted toxin-antitoxin system
MQLWNDAQLSPSLAPWINNTFIDIEAKSLKSIGLRDASDLEIFREAKKVNAIILSKDSDFLKILQKLGPPPKIIWVTCGNTSNERLKAILSFALPKAMDLLKKGENFIEVSDALTK